MTTLETKLKIASWDEKPHQEFDDGSRITWANVELTDGEDGVRAGGFQAVMFYRPDGTSTYVSLIRLPATPDGRSGTFVAAGAGGFDGTTASGVGQIVSGSGTGHLAGISGTVSSASTHADYPYMPLKVAYELP